MPALDRSLIATLPVFKGATDEGLASLLKAARSLRYPREAAIFEQEEDARTFFLLLDGHIRVVKTKPDGEQMIARYINAGELFGIAVAMGLAVYPASAVAAADCVILSWPSDLWPQLIAECPALGAGAYQTIGARLTETQERVLEMSTEQTSQRVAHAVLRLVHQSGRKTDAGIETDFPITRQDLAEMTGTTLHTVSRLISAWEGDGILVGGRQKVTVLDPHRLMLVAENLPRK